MKAKYIGGGDYIIGVPMRDIPQDEWDDLGSRKRALVEQSGLYRITRRKRKQEEEVTDELHS